MEPLKLALIAAGLRQYELAERVGMTETRLSRIVRGRITAAPDEQRAIARTLRTTVRALFGRPSTKRPSASWK